jgi:hypothetical protein
MERRGTGDRGRVEGKRRGHLWRRPGGDGRTGCPHADRPGETDRVSPFAPPIGDGQGAPIRAAWWKRTGRVTPPKRGESGQGIPSLCLSFDDLARLLIVVRVRHVSGSALKRALCRTRRRRRPCALRSEKGWCGCQRWKTAYTSTGCHTTLQHSDDDPTGRLPSRRRPPEAQAEHADTVDGHGSSRPPAERRPATDLGPVRDRSRTGRVTPSRPRARQAGEDRTDRRDPTEYGVEPSRMVVDDRA